jgi:hypothetical protein
MKIKTMLYKDGKTTITDAANHAEFSALLSDGWMDSPKSANSAELQNDGPPTRAELEQKATELALKFDGRTSDAKLGKMIEEALRVVD